MDEPDRTSALQASPSLPVDAEFSGAVTTPASSSAVREEEQRGVSSDGNRSMTSQNGETSTVVRDDTCPRIVLVLAFWFSVSMTMILGLFGSVTLQLGPSSSLLIAPNPFFVEYIKVEKLDEAKTGPLLYGLHKNPLRDVPFTWSETHSASLPLDFHKEWIYVLSEGSQINISFRVNSSSSLVLVIAEGSESFAQWLGDPSYPNTTLSWNIIHGSGMIRQSIFRSSTYYVAVGNLNSEVVELQVNLRVKTFLYNTTDAYYKCPVAHGPCQLKMAFPKGNAAVLTSPSSEQGMTHLWNVKLSYRPRWITYIVSIGVMSVLMLLAFHLLDNIPCIREEQTRFYGEMRSERVPLLSQKSDDLSSWGSSYDSMSHDDEDDPGSLQGKPLKDGECSNNTHRLCAICFDAPRDCFFLPCGHSVACFECGTRIAELAGTCPICRRKMKKVRKIFTV
ncbi:E3 ubiquitin-protein ligase APD2-like isoform X2 [Diospyros lotus]|uniref:E3 ubiquitin-protein ligase APD2-like isoform X2 n=1 Tax=Diospyros lotus TaxID=55363 RepID=UPI002258CB85|nr:E3 ubiquitin-protein ligase APD2-like isoform X2 [Diospyros lotus]